MLGSQWGLRRKACSSEAGYKQDHCTSYGTRHPDYCQSLQMLLSKYYEEVLAHCWVAREPLGVELRQGSSNFFGASSLLRLHQAVAMAAAMERLHQAVAMAAAMVTSVPRDSLPPPGRRKEPPARRRGGRCGGDPYPPTVGRNLRDAAGEEGQPRQQQMNLLSLDEWFARAHNSG